VGAWKKKGDYRKTGRGKKEKLLKKRNGKKVKNRGKGEGEYLRRVFDELSRSIQTKRKKGKIRGKGGSIQKKNVVKRELWIGWRWLWGGGGGNWIGGFRGGVEEGLVRSWWRGKSTLARERRENHPNSRPEPSEGNKIVTEGDKRWGRGGWI